MAIADRVKDTSVSTGTGNFVLSGSAPSGFRALSAIGTVGATFGYVIDGGAEWEVGFGTITATNTFSRSPSAGSNGSALVNFSAGTKTVFHTATAGTLSRGLVDPDDVGYDVILLAGQSNMAGRGTLDSLVELADPRVWQFGGASADGRYRTIFAGNDPLHNAEGVNTGQMSLGTAAGKAYAATRPTNRRVLIVPCASGGTKLYGDTWQSGSPGGTLYENAIAQTNLAIAAALLQYPNSRFVGVFWHQGESDALAGTTEPQYTTALTNVIAGFRARITGAANAWFVIGGMVPEAISGSPASYNPIVAAQQAVALAVDKCIYVAGPSSFTGDNLHFNAAGARIMGARMGLSVRPAAAYIATPVPATAVVMTGPTSGVVSVASANFTVSISGVITGTVRVTPSDNGAGGTFAPAFRDLMTGTASGTFTYTPASTGAKTISATNNGGLSNPTNITYTAAAAATAPATMVAPVATAGDTTASVALTAPSNGGSVITGYSVTSIPAGGVDANAGTTALTHSMTGLTNGTAYTFTAIATNAVGASAASPASNSVTPAAASSALRARAGFTMFTEGGTDPNWTYTGTGGAAFDATGAVMNAGIASAATSGSFSLVRQVSPGGVSGDKFQLCVITGTTPKALADRIFTLLHDGSGSYAGYVGGGAVTMLATVVAAIGDIMHARFTSATTCTYEVSKDGGSSYTALYNQTGIAAGAKNFQLQMLGTGTMGGFVGVGLAAN